MSRFLAFSDVHIGAGQSLGRTPGDRLADQQAVLDCIFQFGVDHDVDGFLMAGDLFEGPAITPEQLEAFIRPFEQLEGRIPLVAINGNGRHDLAMRETNALQPLRHVPGVAVYSTPTLVELAGATVACLPWVSPARLLAREGADAERDRVNDRAAQLFVSVASRLRERCDGPAILLLHGSLSGASLPAGIATDDLREPVIDAYGLLDLGFDAIVAGHIHVPQFAHLEGTWHQPAFEGAVAEDQATFALYTGSPLPLNFGEAHVPHGVWILDLDTDGTRAEFVPVPSRPLRQTTLDLAALDADGIDPVAEFDGILDANAWPDVDDAIVKVTVRATRGQQRRLDLVALRAAITGAGAHTVKVDVDTVREERSRVDSVTADLDPLEAFDAWTAANETDETLAVAAREQMTADLEEVRA